MKGRDYLPSHGSEKTIDRSGIIALALAGIAEGMVESKSKTILSLALYLAAIALFAVSAWPLPRTRLDSPVEDTGEPGVYRFYLAHTWSTRLLANGNYRIEVEAADIDGNKALARLPITIKNRPL